MVLTSKFTFAAALSALIASVASQSTNTFQIFQPSSTWWWVAKSQNVMSWDCKNSPVQQFTVFITNSNPAILTGPLALIAQQKNADCSLLIDKTQINQGPGTGYQIQFSDIINSSKIYATSDNFEIKPLGATYPTSSAASSATGSASASGASATGTSKSNGAFSIKTSTGLSLAAVGAVLGFMTA
ncbi:hypothetical protein APHAL10511_002915 [Amanita phalloides]|nr:hypothetical protein APHAL10511_002915 [Amanita phalloides]